MLFVFGLAFNVMASGMPEDLRDRYQAGEITGNDYCESLAGIAQNLMVQRQIGTPKRNWVTEARNSYDGFNQEFFLLVVERAWNRPQFNSESYIIKEVISFGDSIWEWCDSNLLD